MISFRSLSPRLSPFELNRSITLDACPKVRTNGTMICTLVSPMSFLTRFKASHSIEKAAEKSSLK